MKHKIFTLLLAFATSIATMNADNHSGTCGEHLTWELAGSTLTVSGTGVMDDYYVYHYDNNTSAPWDGYKESIENVIISHGVTRIGDFAFYYSPNLKSVQISNTVEKIGNRVFSGCGNLTTINFPSSLTSMGAHVLSGCKIQSLSLPNSITEIGDDAFSSCSELVSANLPNKLTTIGDRLFCNCHKLASIEIPDGVTYIGWTAFESCTSLTSIVIPNSVEKIGNYAFNYCSGLISVTIGSGLKTADPGVFHECTGLTGVYITDLAAWCSINFDNNSNSNPLSIAHNLYLNGNLVTDMVIPDGVTKVKQSVFDRCTSITSVTFPASVDTIELWSFAHCDNLASVSIPNIKYIGEQAFGFDPLLTFVELPSSLKYIGWGAFTRCTSLQKVILNNGLEEICENAFSYTAIEEITIPETVTKMGDYILSVNDNLKKITWNAINCITSGGFPFNNECPYVTIGDKVEVIPDFLFRADSYVTSKLTAIDLPNSVKEIKRYAFSNCGNATLKMSNQVEKIGERAFQECHAADSIILPNSLTELGAYAFFYCDKAKKLKISNQLVDIPEYTFAGCKAVETIEIPASILTIGQHAFDNCIGAQYISCAAPTPPTCGEGVFTNIDKSTPLYVPQASIDAYKAADQWKDFTDIRPLVDIFHVTFLSWDGTLLKAEYVESGKSANAPDAPEREEYIFQGWDKDYSNVTEDMIITAQYQKEPEPQVPGQIIIDLESATEMVYTGCSATPSVADNVLTVAYSAGSWQWAGVEFALNSITDVTNISFDYKGDGTSVVIYPYLRDSQGARWRKGDYWLNLSATEWQTVSTYLPDALLWDNVDYVFGDKPFVKLGFVANPGTATDGTFYLRNLKIEYKESSLPTNISDVTSKDSTHKFIRKGQLYILRDGKSYTIQGMEVK